MSFRGTTPTKGQHLSELLLSFRPVPPSRPNIHGRKSVQCSGRTTPFVKNCSLTLQTHITYTSFSSLIIRDKEKLLCLHTYVRTYICTYVIQPHKNIALVGSESCFCCLLALQRVVVNIVSKTLSSCWELGRERCESSTKKVFSSSSDLASYGTSNRSSSSHLHRLQATSYPSLTLDYTHTLTTY